MTCTIFGVGNSQNLIPGGKPLTRGATEPSPVIHFRVPTHLRDEIKAAAERDGVSVSNYLRRVVEAHLHGLDG